MGQNLVPNPGFEVLDQSCNGGVSYDELADWVPAQCSSGAFFFHPCSTANGWPQSGAPANLWGEQEAHDGVAYAGVIAYAYQSSFPTVHYLSVPLTQPLVAGVEYCFGLNASLAGRSAFRTATLSAIFTPYYPSVCQGWDTSAWASEAQVIFNTTAVDTTSWTDLTAGFVAEGGEQYLTIGNFSGQADPDSIFIGWTSAPAQRAVYYIDAVQLQPCDVGVPENGEVLFQVQPMPADDMVSLTVPHGLHNATLIIHDALGRGMATHRVQGSGALIPIAHLAAGWYAFEVCGSGYHAVATVLVR